MILHFIFQGEEILAADNFHGVESVPRVGDWITIRHVRDGDPRRGKVHAVEWLYECYELNGDTCQSYRHINIYLEPLSTSAQIGNMEYSNWSYVDYDSLKVKI